MKFKVQVRVARYVEVEVEVPDRDHLYSAAIEAAKADTTVPFDYSIVAGSTVLLDEPWVSTRGWYDLHGPADIIVCERAEGNKYTAEDIKLLRSRLHKIGLKVLEDWNGAGCGTVSFRCSGRKGTTDMSEAHKAILTAPRSAS
jgi:hypothetical protein